MDQKRHPSLASTSNMNILASNCRMCLDAAFDFFVGTLDKRAADEVGPFLHPTFGRVPSAATT